MQQADKRVLLLGDSPFAHAPMGQCMVTHARSLSRCNLDRPNHVVADEMQLERELATSNSHEDPWAEYADKYNDDDDEDFETDRGA